MVGCVGLKVEEGAVEVGAGVAVGGGGGGGGGLVAFRGLLLVLVWLFSWTEGGC